MSAHDQWQVFRGESTELKDLIFSVKKSSVFQLKTKLDVFLANNTKEEVCDFKVKGSWFERSCVVYAGESLNIVAQVRLLLFTCILDKVQAKKNSYIFKNIIHLIKILFSMTKFYS